MSQSEYYSMLETIWALPDSEASELLNDLLLALYDNYAVTEFTKKWLKERKEK